MTTFATVWITVLAILVLLTAWAGKRRANTIWAALIDNRNTGSLAQFQIVVWSFTLIPIIFAAIWERATRSPSTALSLSLDASLWTVLGISTASILGANAIKTQKDQKDNGPLSAGDRILVRTIPQEAGKTPRPKFYFFDMFAYDEGSKALKGLDVTKLQNWIFTVGFACTYIYVVIQQYSQVNDPSALTSLPALNNTILGLMGLSQAGYLTAKALPQNGTPDTSVTATTTAATTLTAAASPAPAAPQLPAPALAAPPANPTPSPAIVEHNA